MSQAERQMSLRVIALTGDEASTQRLGQLIQSGNAHPVYFATNLVPTAFERECRAGRAVLGRARTAKAREFVSSLAPKLGLAAWLIRVNQTPESDDFTSKQLSRFSKIIIVKTKSGSSGGEEDNVELDRVANEIRQAIFATPITITKPSPSPSRDGASDKQALAPLVDCVRGTFEGGSNDGQQQLTVEQIQAALASVLGTSKARISLFTNKFDVLCETQALAQALVDAGPRYVLDQDGGIFTTSMVLRKRRAAPLPRGAAPAAPVPVPLAEKPEAFVLQIKRVPRELASADLRNALLALDAKMTMRIHRGQATIKLSTRELRDKLLAQGGLRVKDELLQLLPREAVAGNVPQKAVAATARPKKATASADAPATGMGVIVRGVSQVDRAELLEALRAFDISNATFTFRSCKLELPTREQADALLKSPPQFRGQALNVKRWA